MTPSTPHGRENPRGLQRSPAPPREPRVPSLPAERGPRSAARGCALDKGRIPPLGQDSPPVSRYRFEGAPREVWQITPGWLLAGRLATEHVSTLPERRTSMASKLRCRLGKHR